MKRLVVDASVVAKWFVREVYSQQALALLRKEHAFAAPDLILPELGNVLWKHHRLQEMSHDEATRILDEFLALPIDIHPSGPLLHSAWRLAVDHDRTVYDCLYLALAIHQNCPLVTADRRLARALAKGPLAGHIRWIGEAD